jgi:hypothetical protein
MGLAMRAGLELAGSLAAAHDLNRIAASSACEDLVLHPTELGSPNRLNAKGVVRHGMGRIKSFKKSK